MSGGLVSLGLETEYRSGENDLVGGFYRPCLEVAVRYDRAAGYFSSTVFTVVGPSIIEFAKRGGKIRLLCSPQLSEEDIDALALGYEDRKSLIANLLESELSDILSREELRDRTTALATLIAVGAMDVKIVIRRLPRYGLFHEKLGVFVDSAGQTVSFKGSLNETWNGWHEEGNIESFEVFRSWVDANEADRVQRHARYFDRLWRGEVESAETLEFPDVVLESLRAVSRSSLEEVRLVETKSSPGRKPLAHQLAALNAWRLQSKRGILEHATGSGKTFTAITAIKEHLELRGVVLVLVPSQLLLKQWADELKRELGDYPLLRAGAGNNLWRKPGRLESFSSATPELGGRMILATLQTACKEDFRSRICDGDHLFVVCDEAHRSGSSENSQVFLIASGPRLGLSATPKRFGDPEGTQLMLDYFGGIVQPPFTLQDAIASGRLVPYEYHPHTVSLNEQESKVWDDLTRRIVREVGKQKKASGGNDALTDALKLLLIQRARVVKKAASKVDLAVDILRKFESDQFWLVYCEDSEQLDEITRRLRVTGLPVNEYHTSMAGDPAESLKWFKNYGGILVSIRCLDEGIDIPQVSHALILASSQNPREFIQRRGRVLRISHENPGKRIAVIHDALVVPTYLETTCDQTSITKSEIARALEFARGAINRAAETELLEIALGLEIDIDKLMDVGFEEEAVSEGED